MALNMCDKTWTKRKDEVELLASCNSALRQCRGRPSGSESWSLVIGIIALVLTRRLTSNCQRMGRQWTTQTENIHGCSWLYHCLPWCCVVSILFLLVIAEVMIDQWRESAGSVVELEGMYRDANQMKRNWSRSKKVNKTKWNMAVGINDESRRVVKNLVANRTFESFTSNYTNVVTNTLLFNLNAHWASAQLNQLE